MQVGRWFALKTDAVTFHIYPLVDSIGHDLDGDLCVCGVTTKLIQDDHGGPDRWLQIHHSLDGLEMTQ